MPFKPTSAEDAFWFALAPATTIPMALYSVSGYVSGEYPYGKPDLESSARNAMGWGALAASVHGWNLLFSPHNASWISGTQAFKVASHWMMTPAMLPVAAIASTAAVGVGYAATSDVHGGAFSVPGGAMSYGPGIYGSDPMGEFEEGASGAMNFLFGWLF